MSPLIQVSLILVGIMFALVFCYHQLCRTIEDVENQPEGGQQKDYRLHKHFIGKKKDKG